MNQTTDFDYQGAQTIQIKIPGITGGQTNTEFPFPNVSYLDPGMAFIKGIESFTASALTYAPKGSNLPVVTDTIFKQSFVTLYGTAWFNGYPGKQGNQIYEKIPLIRLNTVQDAVPNPFVRSVFRTGMMEVDWQKSSVTLGAAPANTTDLYFVFNAYFDFFKDVTAIDQQGNRYIKG